MTMNDEGSAEPVSVDPEWVVRFRVIYVVQGPTKLVRTASRRPCGCTSSPSCIKNDDPHLEFYTMYMRETVEHDTEYMQKYNKAFNTTLIFVCFYSLYLATQR